MPPSSLLAALLNLRPSGKRSFEELVAGLLSKLSGERIRLCKAGTQGGVDALAEVPFAFEAKRHSGQLKTSYLEGGLSAAARSYPDLQLWMLVATCKVAAQDRQHLIDAGLNLGIAVRILDTTRSEPELPGVGGLAALAATDVETTLAVLADRAWRAKGRKPDLQAIGRELNDVRQQPGFDAWRDDLRRELRELPTWRRLVRSQNERVHALIQTKARNAFDTGYDPSQAVERAAERDLTEWVRSRAAAQTSDVVVVTGDQYDGKTWLVYRWLSANLHELPFPVFFFSSYTVMSNHGNLDAVVLHEAEEALGSFARHAQNVIDRQRRPKDGRDASPWCVIVLDGANEYNSLPGARARAVLRALPSETLPLRSDADPVGSDPIITKRGAALLVTCRTRDLEHDSSWLDSAPVRRVNLGPYNESEFADALARHGLTPNDVADLPESAATMIRRPRYLDLVRRHRNELGQFAVITADVLHYLDASDKVRSRMNAHPFKAFLQGLAERWTQQKGRLNYSAIRDKIREVRDDVDASMDALLSEGVLIRGRDGVMPDPERLALGMGLLIRERLLFADKAEQEEELAKILEPHRDDDEKLRWLRAAVTTSLLSGDNERSPWTVDCMLKAWLSSRNFSERDLHDAKKLSPLLLEPMLRLVSADDFADSGVLLMAQAMIESEMPRHRTEIESAIRQWFRLVPMDSFRHEKEDIERDQRSVADAAAEPSLHALALRTTSPQAGRSVRKRHRFGLSLLCAYACAIQPIDLLALVAARGVTLWNLDDGERYALRTLLADADPSWFENEVRTAQAAPESSRTKFLSYLIYWSECADLIALLPPSAPTPRWWRDDFTRENLRALGGAEDEKQILRTAMNAAHLAHDPSCPPPPRAWREKLAKVALERFADSGKLHASRCQTSADLDLEHIAPALAAWAPDTGAQIVHAFFADIPRRIAAEEESWSWAIEGNAALLTTEDQRNLLEIVRATAPKTDGLKHALQRAYLCVMAEAPSTQRLRLLLDHPFDFEWTEFYNVAAAAADESLRKRAEAAVRNETDPRRLMRARHFLARLGGWKPSSADLAWLLDALSQDDSGDAAHTLLQRSRIPTTTPASALGPLVRAADSLSEEAWQYAAFLHVKRHPGLRGAGWIARARSAPLTARRHGADSADDDSADSADDDSAVAQGIERFAARVEELFGTHTLRQTQQFPDGIAGEIDGAAFDRWVARLRERRDSRLLFDPGVIIPVVRHALQTKHPAAKELWTLAYPFPRGRFGSVSRIVVQGLDWALVEIHDPSLDDALARELLRDLILDCRSNSELMSIALAARLESTARLTTVVEELLDSGHESDRARARFVAGWMPESAALRRRLTAPDPSCWVGRIARSAIRRLDREQWAREWLRRFLAEMRRSRRWAAGRLFLACSDAATQFWADGMIHESRSPASRRSEAVLLVGEIRKDVDDHEHRDKFLGYSIRELESVVPPWRTSVRWSDIEVRPEEPT